MIDIHCHILWGVDDASKTKEESLNMIKVAIADGVTTIAASSHMKPPLFDNTNESLLAALDKLYVELYREKLAIHIVFGGENYVAHNTIHKLEEGGFITYNKGKYMLVEFSWTKNVYDQPTQYIKQILAKGYIPVIAHPERYQWVHEDYSLVRKWKEMGCLMQVNRTSIFGYDTMQKANEVALRLLEDDLVDAIASDAHTCYAPRLPKLSDAYKYIETHYGKERAQKYFYEVPQRIIDGK